MVKAVPSFCACCVRVALLDPSPPRATLLGPQEAALPELVLEEEHYQHDFFGSEYEEQPQYEERHEFVALKPLKFCCVLLKSVESCGV